jgi:hypothetical protein
MTIKTTVTVFDRQTKVAAASTFAVTLLLVVSRFTCRLPRLSASFDDDGRTITSYPIGGD